MSTATIPPNNEMLFFQDVLLGNIARTTLLSCPPDTTIRRAASLMSQNDSDSILVTSADGSSLGLVTDKDLRQKVVAIGCNSDQPVQTIISAPLPTISAGASICEGYMVMAQMECDHLFITNTNTAVIGVVSRGDILASEAQTPFLLLKKIAAAENLSPLKELQQQLPGITSRFMASGTKPRNLTRLISMISDVVLQKVISFALEKHGPPPCPFAFMVMGSEGRKEQTLKTDQDNAIIYEDQPQESAEKVHSYFLSLAASICSDLHAVGYSFCKGDIMAQNPKWCQPLSVWKDYFRSWIRFAYPEDLLNCTIFFDLRCAYGHRTMVHELKVYLMERLVEWPLFLGHLAVNAQHFKPPMGFFRNFLVESKGAHRDTFDIKKVMVPIVDFARIFALKHDLPATNTEDRLHQLVTRNFISDEMYTEMEQCYSFLMQLRLARQLAVLMQERGTPDNNINPKKLSRIEQTTLKEIFSRIDAMQKEIVIRVGDQREFG